MAETFGRSLMEARSWTRGLAGCGGEPADPAADGADAKTDENKESAAADPVWFGKPISQWIQELGSNDTSAREAAARALGNIGPPAAAAIPALQKAIDTGSLALCLYALQALASVDANDLPVFARQLTSKTEKSYVRRMAIDALGYALKPENRRTETGSRLGVRPIDDPSIDPKAAAAARLLSALLKDDDADLRLAAVDTLSGLGHEAAAAVPALAEAVAKNEDGKVRAAALSALISVGPAAAAAVAPLVTSKDELVRLSADLLITNNASRRSALVAAMLKDKDDSVRLWAARWLNEQGEIIRNAQRDQGVLDQHGVQTMVAALKDGNAEVRSNVAAAIGKIGTKGSPIDPVAAALAEAGKDSDEKVREAAATALEKIKAP
jgi:HEAT repeat protein